MGCAFIGLSIKLFAHDSIDTLNEFYSKYGLVRAVLILCYGIIGKTGTILCFLVIGGVLIINEFYPIKDFIKKKFKKKE